VSPHHTLTIPCISTSATRGGSPTRFGPFSVTGFVGRRAAQLYRNGAGRRGPTRTIRSPGFPVRFIAAPAQTMCTCPSATSGSTGRPPSIPPAARHDPAERRRAPRVAGPPDDARILSQRGRGGRPKVARKWRPKWLVLLNSHACATSLTERNVVVSRWRPAWRR
jgi:hypothetical protein